MTLYVEKHHLRLIASWAVSVAPTLAPVGQPQWVGKPNGAPQPDQPPEEMRLPFNVPAYFEHPSGAKVFVCQERRGTKLHVYFAYRWPDQFLQSDSRPFYHHIGFTFLDLRNPPEEQGPWNEKAPVLTRLRSQLTAYVQDYQAALEAEALLEQRLIEHRRVTEQMAAIMDGLVVSPCPEDGPAPLLPTLYIRQDGYKPDRVGNPIFRVSIDGPDVSVTVEHLSQLNRKQTEELMALLAKWQREADEKPE